MSRFRACVCMGECVPFALWLGFVVKMDVASVVGVWFSVSP